MRDRAVIDIDWAAGHVSLNCDHLDSITIDRQIETTHSYLIASILAPQIRELMHMSKPELWERYLASLKVPA